MKDTIDEFSASMTFLERRTVPVPPARMRNPNTENVEGFTVPVGLLCPPEDDDELDEGGGKNVDCHDIVEEDEKPKGGDDDDPVKETMEEPINKKRQSMVTLAEDEENMEEEVASISSTVQDHRPPHPYANASLISKLFFSWPYSLMGKKTASCRVIQESDLPDVLDSDTSEANLRKFQALWEQEKARASKVNDKTPRNGSAFEATPKAVYPSLARAIKNDFLFSLWFVQLSMFVNAVGKMAQALSLGFLLQSLESQNGAGYCFAGILVLSGFVVLVSHHHCWWWTTQTGMRYRLGAIAAIHDKTLHLASASVDSVTSSGRAINLATNDVERFLMSCMCGSYIMWTPLLSIGIFIIGWNIIGWPFASGFALLVLVIVPFQLSLSKKFAIVRAEIASIADERVTLLSQAIAGARVMKIYTYESKFERKIASIRQKEVSSIQRVNRYRALNEAIYFSATIFTSPIIFVIDVLSGGKLTPMKVFTTFVLINIAQQELTKYLSVGIMGVSEAKVSISRIQKFLELPELSPVKTPPPLTNEDGHASIVVSQATCHWNRSLKVKGPNFRVHGDQSTPNSTHESAGLVVALDNISLRFDSGTLTCVIGEVGSGKSALLQMLAGEIALSSGLIQMQAGSTLAYASQEPFLMQGSVRENILFGRPYDGLTYQTVSHACGLDKDFAQLSDGDATIVGGNRGVQLSGGQRARVALARAFYHDGDILLLDDPLSAVDSKVGRQLFAAIQDLGVKRGKCVVLVTHQHQYIGDSRCVKMTGGRSCIRDAPDLTLSHDMDECDDQEKKAQSSRQDVGVDCGNNKCNVPSSSCTPIIDNDDKNSSNVGVATFISYFKAMPGGLWSGFLVLLLFTLSQGVAAATIALSGKWSMLPHGDQLSRAIVATISGCVLGSIILAVVRGILLFHLVIEASSNLHHSMTKSVLRAKINFFDQPVGSILDRFSADVGSNDDLLPGLLSDVLTISFMVLGAVTIAITVLPIALILMPPMLLVLIRVRRTFMTSSRELKRLEGAARSSMLALLSESLGGIVTIRSNDAGDFFRRRFRNAHDAHGRACFALAACSRWFGFLMDTIMFGFMAIASFTAVVANDQAWLDIDPNLLGLALTMLIQLSGLFQYGVRQSAEVVNQMVAVDRVLGYHDLPSEAAVTARYDDEVSTEWPQKGAISVRGLNVRYRPGLPLSLRSLTFEIPGGSRVGVVGRTGCGKSTLVQSLIRLLEAEDGQIFIDSVDISKLGLSKLRRSISIMPQFPVLYGGISLRDNLDPFHHREDEEIYQALVHVSMVDAVESLPCGLDTIMSEGGSCFSAGQKQLLCLVRAVLRKNKILVLDEPTANVDSHTDKLLQEAVAENFEGATILAIAHRLDTVIDYDKILVLGSGGVLEYGSPRELIANRGVFSMMLDETAGMASMLKARAETHDVVTATDL